MAVTATTTSVSYAGNGSTTAFSVPFKFLADTDLVVTLTVGITTSTATLGSIYTVTGAGVDAGGTVTFGTAPATGITVTISRTTPATQPVSFQVQGEFSSKVHEVALDRVTLLAQESSSSIAGLASRITTLELGAGGPVSTRASLLTLGYFGIDAAVDYGILADDSTDNSAALNTLWTDVKNIIAAGRSVWVNFPAGYIRHSQTQSVVGGLYPMLVTGARGGSGFAAGGTVFRWTGAAGGKMFHTAGINRSVFQDFALDGMGVADVLMHNDATLIDGTTIVSSSGNTFTRIAMFGTRKAQAGTVGACLVGSATQPGTQFSEGLYDDCFFSPEHGTSSPNTMTAFGWKTASGANCKNFTLKNCHWNFCNITVDWLNGSGSLRVDQIDMAEVRQAFQQGAGGQLTVIGGDIENTAVTDFRLHKCASAGGDDVTFHIQGVECFAPLSSHILNETYCSMSIKNCVVGDPTGGTYPAFVLRAPLLVSEGNHYINMGSSTSPFIVVHDSAGNDISDGITARMQAKTSIRSFNDRGGALGSQIALRPIFGTPPEVPYLKPFQNGYQQGDLTIPPAYEGQVRRVTMSQVLTYHDAINGKTSNTNSVRKLMQKFPDARLADAWARIDTSYTGAGAAVNLQINLAGLNTEDYMAGQDVTAAAGTRLGTVDAQRGHIFKPGDALYNSMGDHWTSNSNFVFAQWITAGNLSNLSAGQVTVYLTYEFFT